MDADYERVLLTKNEVFVYRIPPLTTSKGHKATDWELDKPMWTGRLQIVSKGNLCAIKLLDKDSGNLFGRAPIESYPGAGIEAVTDSSRYFVIKLVNEDDPKKTAFIGIGFADRGDSFDLNVALQDHFKSVKQDKEIEDAGGSEAFIENQPKLDLGFKEGQTIKVNINIPKKSGTRPKAKPAGSGILPPPPGGIKIAPPSLAASSASSSSSSSASSSTRVAPPTRSQLSFDSSDSNGSATGKPVDTSTAVDSLVDLEFDMLSMTDRPNINSTEFASGADKPISSAQQQISDWTSAASHSTAAGTTKESNSWAQF